MIYGYGSPVFGLHLYTWGLIACACQIAASAMMLLGVAWLRTERGGYPPAVKLTVFASRLSLLPTGCPSSRRQGGPGICRSIR